MSHSLDFAVHQARIDDFHRHAAEVRRARRSERPSRLSRIRAAVSRPRGIRSAPRPAGAAEQL